MAARCFHILYCLPYPLRSYSRSAHFWHVLPPHRSAVSALHPEPHAPAYDIPHIRPSRSLRSSGSYSTDICCPSPAGTDRFYFHPHHILYVNMGPDAADRHMRGSRPVPPAPSPCADSPYARSLHPRSGSDSVPPPHIPASRILYRLHHPPVSRFFYRSPHSAEAPARNIRFPFRPLPLHRRPVSLP